METIDEMYFQDRQNEVRDYMDTVGVTIADITAECHVSRSTVKRWLRHINTVSEWIQIIDNIVDRKSA